MAGDVVIGNFSTTLPIPVDRVCDAAKGAGLTLCIVIGVDDSGEFYFASSEPEGAKVLWQLERAKKAIMEMP